MFDPFCRWKKIKFLGMDTTVGQLNFFRWFIEKDILEHVMEHRELIEKDMNSTLKQHYSRSNTTLSTARSSESESQTLSMSSSGTIQTTSTDGSGKTPRKKRCELTQSAMKKVNIHECEVMVSFC
jgi:hypothetical protein